MTPAEVEALPLHESKLLSVEVLWSEARCRIRLLLPSGKHLLEFANVTMVRISRTTPWVSSLSVNGASENAGVVTIEMQSGDTIEIAATEFEFSAL